MNLDAKLIMAKVNEEVICDEDIAQV